MTKKPASNRVGRPDTRHREAFMLAIWRAVQEQIHTHGAPSVRRACTQVFEQRARCLIKFVDADGTVIDVIAGIAGADTLRQRYLVADKCRHDAERYPMLHARAAQLEKILPGTFERVKAGKAEVLRLQNTGKWPL
jgi:hypothetical protein